MKKLLPSIDHERRGMADTMRSKPFGVLVVAVVAVSVLFALPSMKGPPEKPEAEAQAQRESPPAAYEGRSKIHGTHHEFRSLVEERPATQGSGTPACCRSSPQQRFADDGERSFGRFSGHCVEPGQPRPSLRRMDLVQRSGGTRSGWHATESRIRSGEHGIRFRASAAMYGALRWRTIPGDACG